VLIGRTETVTAQEASLAEREIALTTLRERIAGAEQELKRVQHEETRQRSALDVLQKETDRLREEASSALADFQEVDAAVRKQRQVRADMERRQVSLETAERALEQRVAETEEIELRIRQELDRQHREVMLETQELERRREQMMQESDEKEL